jgi:hypothetical protein
MYNLFPIIGGAVGQIILEDPINEILKNTRDINDIKYDMSDYEVGYSIKDNKTLNYNDLIICSDDICIDKKNLIKEKQQKIKNNIEQIRMSDKDKKVNITKYVNMESMANISSVSFFIYTGYKIIKYIDNNI